MTGAEDVTPGEIVRTLRGLQDEIRALRGEHVRRDLYEAHRATTTAELARLENEMNARERDRAAMRRQVTIAAVGAGLALLVQLITLLVGGSP